MAGRTAAGPRAVGIDRRWVPLAYVTVTRFVAIVGGGSVDPMPGYLGCRRYMMQQGDIW